MIGSANEKIIRDRVLAMKRDGWKIKFVHKEGAFIAFRANKKHVNLRSRRTSGWLFEIWVRNANGGYDKLHRMTELELAIAKAMDIAKGKEPAIPVWDRDKLPDAYPLPSTNIIRYTKISRTIAFETIINYIIYRGIVSINKNCTISDEAAAIPGNKVWFFLDCSGTRGGFTIITDGEKFYPLRKIRGESKHKISLDLNVGSVDLEHMTGQDTEKIVTAVKLFANDIP